MSRSAVILSPWDLAISQKPFDSAKTLEDLDMYDPLAGQKGAKQELRSLMIFAGFLAISFLIFVYPNTDNFDLSKDECQRMNAFWAENVLADYDLSDDWNSARFECPSREASFSRALDFISRLEEPLPGRNSKDSYYGWAKSIKPTFGSDVLFGLAGRALIEERRIDISPSILDTHNWVKIAGVIVHELRHLEQGINTHVPCRVSPAKACDARLELNPTVGGAYSYNIYFFHQVRSAESTTRYEKTLAKREMQEIISTRFNTVNREDYRRFDLEAPEP